MGGDKPAPCATRSWTRHRPLLRAFVLLGAAILVLAGSARAAGRPLAGLPLPEALDELRRSGLPIVYSSALVRQDMVVASEPTASDPRSILDQILAPHGLAVRQGPGRQLVVVLTSSLEPSPPVGSIRGQVEAEADPTHLAGVTVRLVETATEVQLSVSGRFELEQVPVGEYTLETESAWFLPSRVASVEVRAGHVSRVQLRLVPRSVFLHEIVVSPSHFRILEDEPESRQLLSRQEVEEMPHVADDLYRAVTRLPGTAAGDYSARFSVRGGEPDELLVVLDGLELYEPFHLKDFQSIFSTVDAAAVGGVDFLTGTFPVEYGDRMSGVMDIAIATPSGPATTSAGIGTINARLLSEGTFHESRGSWLISARGWYPDALIDSLGVTAEELLSDFYDVLAKVEHRVGERSLLAVDVLVAYDDLGFGASDEEETEAVRARYRSHHVWSNLRTEWSDALFSETVVAIGRVGRERLGSVNDIEEGTLEVDDDRDFDFVGFSQDWTLGLDERHLVKWGVEARRNRAAYDYHSLSVVTDPEVVGDGPPLVEEIDISMEPDGESYGAYLADRFRLGRRLVAEVGLRWDKQLWIGDHQLSPRLNLRCDATPRTVLRVGWGRYYQSQRLNELQVEDGVTEFHPAQRADQWSASVEHRMTTGLGLRLEAYHKELDRLRSRYENMFSPIELFPEAQMDRVLVAPERGRAQGIELVVKQDRGTRLTWWGSYALSRAEDQIGGEMVPRSWDQRHAASLGLNLSLARGWNVGLGAIYHSGWPTTGVTGWVVGEDPDDEPIVELSYGPRNRERYPDYYRLDLRTSKTWSTRRGDVAIILDVMNLTDRKNVCCVDDFVAEVADDGSVTVIREERTWAPQVPSLGLSWQF